MKFSVLALSALLGLGAGAAVTVDKMFTDHMVLQRDLAVPIWGVADAGETVTVGFRGQTKTGKTSADGKWLIKLDPMQVGDAADLTVSGSSSTTFTDVLVGEVWLGSGQSNMAGGVGGYMKNDEVLTALVNGGPYPNLRLYGRTGWQVADATTAPAFSAIHFAFGCNLYKELKVPVGLMYGAVGGTPSGRWLSDDMAAADAELMKQLAAAGYASVDALNQAIDANKKKWNEEMEAHKAAAGDPKKAPKFAGPNKFGDLYAAHIQAKVPYGIRGVLWDQGESKTQIPGVDQYAAMHALITGWRKVWGQGDFFFLHIQKPSGEGCAWDPADPITKGAAAFSPDLPTTHITNPNTLGYPLTHIKIGTLLNAPLVTASDLGTGIHPQCKSGYGKRACQVALGAVYGQKVAISGPIYKSHKVEGATIRVSFDHIGQGLACRHADTVRGFEIAGEDGKFAWADAKIDGDAIVLSSPEVPKPVNVQYAFAPKHTFANLFNKDGLPAQMFTTLPWNAQ